MSFLTEILSSAQEYDMQQLVNKLPEVCSQVDVYKSSVNKYLDNAYITLDAQRKNTALLQQSKKLNGDMNELIQIADELGKRDLPTCSLNLNNMKADLEKSYATYQIASKIFTVHEALQNAALLHSQKCYMEAMMALTDVEHSLEVVPKEQRTQALDKMITLIDVQKNSLITEVNCDILKNIVIDTSNNEEYVLKVSKKNEVEIAQRLLILELYSDCIEPLSQILDFLWNYAFIPIVIRGASVEIEEVDEFNIMIIVETDKKSDASYLDKFNATKKVLDFLYSHLNFPLQKHKSSLNYIGNDLEQNLSELLIKNCLEQTIPSRIEDLEKFKEVIDHTEQLQNQLVQTNIFSEDFLALIEYVKNIDTLFVNKKCVEYTEKALVLMKKDLHDMVEVGEPHEKHKNLYELPENIFPKCAVSKSCVAILELVEMLLQQCLSSNNLQPERVISTAQNIFYKYKSVVPEYHKKLLETIPQQVALFHNNCMYIANRLTQWNEEYKTKLPSTLLGSSAIFVDQPCLLRAAGANILSSYVKQQVDQIESIVKQSGIDRLQAAEELPPSIEKAIRQCLRQQELLKTVWQKVLSYSVYNKAIGVIMNSLCVSLTSAILAVEDIPSKLDEQLVEVFKVVVARAPKLFTDPREICLFVKNWNKFNELIFVLSASLVDIDDRWASGKGPLALHFQAEEVRRLIRALFQNTSRRAEILTRICT